MGLRLLESGDSKINVVDTSFLYETEPMYVEDQLRFVNGACLVSCFSMSMRQILRADGRVWNE